MGFWTDSAYSIVHATPEFLGAQDLLVAARDTSQHFLTGVIVFQIFDAEIDDLPKLITADCPDLSASAFNLVSNSCGRLTEIVMINSLNRPKN